MAQKRKNTWVSDVENSDCSSPKPKKGKNNWLSNTSNSDITSMGECLSDTDSDGTDNASSSGRESSVDMKAKSRTENGEFCVRDSGIQSKPNSWLSESECSDMPSLLTISDNSDAESEPDPDESLELESEHGCPTRGAAASGPSDVCSDGLSDVAPSNTPWWSYPLWEKTTPQLTIEREQDDGHAWWSYPLWEKTMEPWLRNSDLVPLRRMIHESLCSGLGTEVFAMQASQHHHLI